MCWSAYTASLGEGAKSAPEAQERDRLRPRRLFAAPSRTAQLRARLGAAQLRGGAVPWSESYTVRWRLEPAAHDRDARRSPTNSRRLGQDWKRSQRRPVARVPAIQRG